MAQFSDEELKELASLTNEQIEKLNYETAMTRLEAVVEALEQGGAPLELALNLYKVGSLLSRKCGDILDSTEEKMLQLLGTAQNPSEAPFDIEKDGR